MAPDTKKTTIGWHIGTEPHHWAFKSLSAHLIKAMPDFEHKINERGEINVLLYPDLFRQMEGDKTTILHVDSHRWYQNYGKEIYHMG